MAAQAKQNTEDYKFENLPDVILLKVFGLLNVADLCRVGRVCSRWNRIAKCPTLWKWVDVQDMQLTAQQVQKLIPILPQCVMYLRVRSFSIQHKIPFLPPQVASEIGERCPQLQALIIESAFLAKHVHFTQLSFEDLPKKLLILSMRNCFFHADQFFCCAQPALPNIRVIDCCSCWCIRDYDMPFFARLSDLQEVYLAGCQLTDEGARLLLKSVQNLKVIDMEGTYIGNSTVIHFLDHSQCLEKLFIGATKVTDFSLCLIQNYSLPKLTVLCLSRTDVTTAGLRNAITNLKQLQCLYIAEDQISKDAIAELSSLVPLKNGFEIKYSQTDNDRRWCSIRTALGYCDHFLDRKIETNYVY